MRSLQAQLSVGLAASLIVLFVLQWVAVSTSIRYLVQEYVASRLERDAESLLAAVQFTPAGQLALDQLHIDPVYRRPFSGHYYRITTALEDLRSRSLWDEELSAARLDPGEALRVMSAGPQRQALLVQIEGFMKQGWPLTIAVAEDLSPVESNIRVFQRRYALVSLSALATLLVLQYLVVRSGLAPLERIRGELSRLERGEVQELGSQVPVEVVPLVAQINRLLQVLAQRLQRSRNALGNLAHAIKTPLTLLRQVAERDELRDCPELRADLQAHTAALGEIVGRELKRARLAGTAAPGGHIELQPEIAALVDTLKTLYRDRCLHLEYRVPEDARFSGDREDLLELLGNLLDNACKWARSTVCLTVESDAGLLLRVEDDGPGCPPEELEQLAQRGVRADEHTAGHGLGLAITRDVVEQYRGRLTFGCSQALGGFLAEVWLPNAGG